MTTFDMTIFDMNATNTTTEMSSVTNNGEITIMLFIGLGIFILTFCIWMMCRYISQSKELKNRIDSQPETNNNRRGSRVTFVI